MENVAGPWPLPQRGSTEGKRLPEPWPEMGIHFIQKAKILVVPCIFSFFYVNISMEWPFLWQSVHGELEGEGRTSSPSPPFYGIPSTRECGGLSLPGACAGGPRRVPPLPCTVWMFPVQPRPVLDYDPQLRRQSRGRAIHWAGACAARSRGTSPARRNNPMENAKQNKMAPPQSSQADRFNVAARHVLHAHPGDVQHRG